MYAAEDSEFSDNFGVLSWYKTSNSTPTGFSINSFGLKLISRRLKRKVTERGEGKRVRVPGLGEFVVTADSEASDAESPRFEGNAGAEVPTDAPGGGRHGPHGTC